MKTEYNHGGALSNIWQDRNEFRWANRAGEGAESTFELAVQAAGAALTAPLCAYCSGHPMPYHPMIGCTCGVSDAEFNAMWSAIAD
jgi:hypothetical protein